MMTTRTCFQRTEIEQRVVIAMFMPMCLVTSIPTRARRPFRRNTGMRHRFRVDTSVVRNSVEINGH